MERIERIENRAILTHEKHTGIDNTRQRNSRRESGVVGSRPAHGHRRAGAGEQAAHRH
jgi:hypothetical protein